MQFNRYAFLGKTLVLFALLLAARFLHSSRPTPSLQAGPATAAARPDTASLIAVSGRQVPAGRPATWLVLPGWQRPACGAVAAPQ